MVFKVFWKSISQCQHIMEGGGNECFVLSFARFLMSSASDWAARFRLLPLSLQTAPLSGSPKLSFVILNEWCVSAYPNNKAQSRIKGWSAVSYLWRLAKQMSTLVPERSSTDKQFVRGPITLKCAKLSHIFSYESNIKSWFCINNCLFV